MLQSVVTVISLMILLGTLALIAGLLAKDWRMVMRAFRNDRQFRPLPLPVQARITWHDHRAQVISVRSQSSPQYAVA